MAEANGPVSPQISVVDARLDISFATMSREINSQGRRFRCAFFNLRNVELKLDGEIIRRV